MILENSCKIGMNKMNLVWRILVYQIIGILLLSGIVVASCYALFKELSACGFLTQVGDFISANLFNFRLDEIFGGISILFNDLMTILASSPTLIVYFVLFVFIIIFVGSFILGLINLPLCECVYGYMGSCSKLNFMGFYISNFKRSIKYALCRLITITIFDTVIIVVFFSLLKLFVVGGALKILAPFIIILSMIILFTIRQSFLGLWSASIIVNNNKIWKSLRDNFKTVIKNFKYVIGNVLLSVICAFAINYGLSVVTCGVSLFVTIPTTVLYFNVMSMVMYFNFNGLRYYIDKDRIITPKKLEDRERIQDIKNII